MLPVFERHGITAQHCRQFLATDEHHRVSELEAINLVSHLEQNRTRTRTNIRIQDACSSALANFATARWPGGMAELMFPNALRKKLVTAAARIETVADIARKLGQNFAFETSVLGDHADKLISIIKTTVSPVQKDVDPRDTGIREYSETPHGISEEYIESGESTQGQQTMPQVERARRTRRARSARRSSLERGSDRLVGNDSMQGQSRLNRRGEQPRGSRGF